MPKPKQPTLARIHQEANPSQEVQAEIDRMEDELAAMTDLEDWTEAEVRELLDETAAVQNLLLPGKVHGYHPSLKPQEPTTAAPGSEEKIRIMRERVKRGESCFHPADAPLVPRREII